MNEACMVVDIGTGNARVAVVTTGGELLGVAREDVRYEKDPLYPDSIYFDPALLWQQILRLAGAALQQARGVKIRAFTATSQREGIRVLKVTAAFDEPAVITALLDSIAPRP